MLSTVLFEHVPTQAVQPPGLPKKSATYVLHASLKVSHQPSQYHRCGCHLDRGPQRRRSFVGTANGPFNRWLFHKWPIPELKSDVMLSKKHWVGTKLVAVFRSINWSWNIRGLGNTSLAPTSVASLDVLKTRPGCQGLSPEEATEGCIETLLAKTLKRS